MCECIASGKFLRLSVSYSSGFSHSGSQVESSIDDGASNVTGVSGSNKVGEEKSMIFKTFSGPLPFNTH